MVKARNQIELSSDEHPELRRNRRVREYWQLVAATANYRFRICWEGARRILTNKGYDPSRTIFVTCDQGRDVHATFIVPDGTVVSCDFQEDPITRQAIALTSWESIEATPEPDAYSLGVEILKDSRLRDPFDRAVLAFFDFHWREEDRPLPSLTK